MLQAMATNNNHFLQLPNVTFVSPQMCYDSSSSVSFGSEDEELYKNEKDFKETYDDLIESIPIYEWQQPIVNQEAFGAIFPNLKDEIMNNPFCDFDVRNWNDILKKVHQIRNDWMGRPIRTLHKGCNQYSSWKKNEIMQNSDVLALKLYTDYEQCQSQLKKCYRRPSCSYNGRNLLLYEKRLHHFYQWNKLLSTAIQKYGSPMRYQIFYHGMNKLMRLHIDPTQRYQGPFSVTNDLDIARGFATKNGIILKLMSKYPRLNTDYAFNASLISAFKDEKEILIGHCYTRILKVSLQQRQLPIDDKERITKLACFVISSLIYNHLYSYCESLELIFKALLFTDPLILKNEELDEEQNEKYIRIQHQIAKCVIKKFQQIRYNKSKRNVLKLDQISDGLRPYFYHNKSQQMLSLNKVLRFMPCVTHLYLYEGYTINNKFITHFVECVSTKSLKHLSAIKVLKFNFVGSCKQFNWLDIVSKHNKKQLQKIGWIMSQHYDTAGNSYRFQLVRNKQ